MDYNAHFQYGHFDEHGYWWNHDRTEELQERHINNGHAIEYGEQYANSFVSGSYMRDPSVASEYSVDTSSPLTLAEHGNATPPVDSTRLERGSVLDAPNRLPKAPRLPKGYKCDLCSGSTAFDTQCDLNRHKRVAHEKPSLCLVPGCNKRFPYPKDLRRHENSVHPLYLEANRPGYHRKVHVCPYASCDKYFTPYSRQDNLQRHIRNKHAADFALTPSTDDEWYNAELRRYS